MKVINEPCFIDYILKWRLLLIGIADSADVAAQWNYQGASAGKRKWYG